MSRTAHEEIVALCRAERERDRLLGVAKLAYRKHALDDPEIGWDELQDALYEAVCNAIGDDEYVAWVESLEVQP